MNNIHFKEVSKDNLYDICVLSNTLSDVQKKFVAINAYSIAEAHYNTESAWFRGIYLDETPIGFVMVDIKMEDPGTLEVPGAFLWRFMIGKEFQGKGYGKTVIEKLADQYRQEGKKFFYTSCGLGDGGPYDFYMKNGFVDTGVMEDDEQILKMQLDSVNR